MEARQKVFVVPSDLQLKDVVVATLSHPVYSMWLSVSMESRELTTDLADTARYGITTKGPFQILEIQQLQSQGDYSSWFSDQHVIQGLFEYHSNRAGPSQEDARWKFVYVYSHGSTLCSSSIVRALLREVLS